MTNKAGELSSPMDNRIYGNIDLLRFLESTRPHEICRVKERIDPRECEHAGYEEALRERGKRPWVIFEQSLRADGERWRDFSRRAISILSVCWAWPMGWISRRAVHSI